MKIKPGASNKAEFTYSALSQLPLPEKTVRYYDAVAPHLVLEVRPTGRKTFQGYKKVGKSPKTVKLGELKFAADGKAMADDIYITLEQARLRVAEVVAQLEQGVDPRSLGITLEQALERYIAKGTKGKPYQESTETGYRQKVDCYLQDWKALPMWKITRDMVLERHQHISAEHSLAQADNTFVLLRAIFNYLKRSNKGSDGVNPFADNPVDKLDAEDAWNDVSPKNTYVRTEQLPALLNTIEKIRDAAEQLSDGSASERERAVICDALWFTLFSGLRRSEVFELAWPRVRLEEGRFWIDETKNGEPIELPINAELRKVLERRWADRKPNELLVFPSMRPGRHIADPRRVMREIYDETVRVNGGKAVIFTMHDLRRTFATHGEKQVTHYTLKQLLNHKIPERLDVTAAYVCQSAEVLMPHAQRIVNCLLSKAKRQTDIAFAAGEILRPLNAETKRELMKLLAADPAVAATIIALTA